MRFVALSLVMLAVGCGGQVDLGPGEDAGVDTRKDEPKPDAPVAETIITPGCCELEAPSCGCVVVGTLPDGTCSKVCDARPVGWTRGTDERGCPKWNVPGGSCAPTASCPGTADFCGGGCVAVQGQQYNASVGCLNPSATAGCMAPGGGCTGALTCKVRISDGAVFKFFAGCPLDGWRECSGSEYMTVMAAPTCGAVDAG